MNLQELGLSLVAAREERFPGMTAQDVARAIGVSRPYLSELENGHKEPTLSMLAKLAEGYGCEVGDLFTSRRPRMSDFNEVAEALSGVDLHSRKRILKQLAFFVKAVVLAVSPSGKAADTAEVEPNGTRPDDAHSPID